METGGAATGDAGRQRTSWTPGRWGTVLFAALGISFLVALRNYYLLLTAGRPMPFWEVLVGEIPFWLVWALLLPAVVRLARRFPPLGRRWIPNSVLHVVVGLAASLVALTALILVRGALLPNFGASGPRLGDPGFLRGLWQLYLNVSTGFLSFYLTVVGMVLAWTYYREQQRRHARESQLAATLARTERDLLRAQLQPHFLFNTLNTISALAVDDPQGARRMISRLSDLLRLLLEDDSRSEVGLDEELEFVGGYIDIQQIRFGDRLRVERSIEPEARRLLLPRLLLQPLVENAIQHGIANLEEGGTIRIGARVEAGASGASRLVVEIANDGPGEGEARRVPGRGGREGLGLRNCRARLQQLYGPAAALTLDRRPDGVTVVRLEVPAHADTENRPEHGEP